MAIQLYWRTYKDGITEISTPSFAQKEDSGIAHEGETLNLKAGGVIDLAAGDRIYCGSGRVWITLKGGREIALASGNWTYVPQDAKNVWLSALSASTIRVTKKGTEVASPTRLQLASFVRYFGRNATFSGRLRGLSSFVRILPVPGAA